MPTNTATLDWYGALTEKLRAAQGALTGAALPQSTASPLDAVTRTPDMLVRQLAEQRTAPSPSTAVGAVPAFAGGGDAGGVNPEFGRRLAALVKASGGRVRIGNDYRSTARQAQLFAAAVKKYGSVAAARKWVAPPGHSKHNAGLAADLKGDIALAHQLAAQFGLYFPMGHEPWHVELRGSRG